jgi:hypothetical protein
MATILWWVSIHLTSISTIFGFVISNDQFVEDDEPYLWFLKLLGSHPTCIGNLHELSK